MPVSSLRSLPAGGCRAYSHVGAFDNLGWWRYCVLTLDGCGTASLITPRNAWASRSAVCSLGASSRIICVLQCILVQPFQDIGPAAQECLPQATFTVLPDVGHVPMFDDPALVA